jgi:hypothetical protein
MNINKFGNATKEMISEFEQHIGFILPADYKKFLMDYNGGTAQKRYSTFFVEALGQEIPLDVLYRLNVDKFDLKKLNDEYMDDLFENTIIIGDDHGNGLFVLINSSKMKGVYYWDHSQYFEQSSKAQNIYKISDDFQEFLDGLKN